jgi:hypothetical protein
MKITILGMVPKGDAVREGWVDWKTEYVRKISEAIPDAIILHGDHIRDDAGPDLVVGHDLWTVKHANVVFVDAREKIGAGTAQEMLMAKFYAVPVVTVLPKDSHHRRSNITFNGVTLADWIHPFLAVCSDHVADDIDDAIAWTLKLRAGTVPPVKDMSVFEKTISDFEHELPDMVQKYKEQGW